MKHTDIKKLFVKTSDFVNKEVTVCGWVRTWRDSKSVSFIELNDGTCLSNLQLVIEKGALNESAFLTAKTASKYFVRGLKWGIVLKNSRV